MYSSLVAIRVCKIALLSVVFGSIGSRLNVKKKYCDRICVECHYCFNDDDAMALVEMGNTMSV